MGDLEVPKQLPAILSLETRAGLETVEGRPSPAEGFFLSPEEEK